jgi:membrane protein DedA with SNARE-associated domain
MEFIFFTLSISGQIFNFVVNIIDKFGYFGIFALMVMESATLPVPSEAILPLAGFLVFQGKLDFWLVLIVASAGSLVGTLIDYYIGYYLGRTVILRYGRYVKLSEKHLVTSEKWFDKFGEITVLLARFVPLIRTVVAFPAGIAEMKIWKFIVFSLVGIFIWDGVLIYLGVLAGQNSNQIISLLTRYFTIVEVLAVVVAIVAAALFIERRRSKAKEEETSKPPSSVETTR